MKQDFEGIIPALNAVYGGQSVFGQDIVDKLPELMNKKNALELQELRLSMQVDYFKQLEQLKEE